MPETVTETIAESRTMRLIGKRVPKLDAPEKATGLARYIEDLRLPKAYFRWKLEKKGYQTVITAAPTIAFDISNHKHSRARDLHRVLDEEGSIPPGMVRVVGTETDAGPLGDFLIDRYEVTNGQYKDFVDAGGIELRKYGIHLRIRRADKRRKLDITDVAAAPGIDDAVLRHRIDRDDLFGYGKQKDASKYWKR